MFRNDHSLINIWALLFFCWQKEQRSYGLAWRQAQNQRHLIFFFEFRESTLEALPKPCKYRPIAEVLTPQWWRKKHQGCWSPMPWPVEPENSLIPLQGLRICWDLLRSYLSFIPKSIGSWFWPDQGFCHICFLQGCRCYIFQWELRQPKVTRLSFLVDQLQTIFCTWLPCSLSQECCTEVVRLLVWLVPTFRRSLVLLRCDLAPTRLFPSRRPSLCESPNQKPCKFIP